MNKTNKFLRFAWGISFLLFLFQIALRLLSHPLENLIDHCTFLWLVYNQIPQICIILITIFTIKDLIRFSFFKIDLQEIIRYFYSFLVVSGIISISYFLISLIDKTPVLIQLDYFNNMTRNFSSLFYLKLLIIAPFCEEFVFRGIILNDFLKKYTPFKSIFLASTLFAIFHFNAMQLFTTFMLGLLTGWYFYKTKNLLSCMIIHSISNLVGITIIRYFIGRLKFQIITVDTKIFQLDNVWIFLVMAACLIIVGYFYLYSSVSISYRKEE